MHDEMGRGDGSSAGRYDADRLTGATGWERKGMSSTTRGQAVITGTRAGGPAWGMTTGVVHDSAPRPSSSLPQAC